jgi:hypothetical protein
MEWFNKVCAQGLVVLPKDGVKNPVVIVWDKTRGFDVLNLFDFIEGECVAFYMGRRRARMKNGAKRWPHNFSTHTINDDDNVSIDGTPDSELSVEVMADLCGAGALIGSSRRQYDTHCATGANLSNPQGLPASAQRRQLFLMGGEELLAVPMHGLKPTRHGSCLAWDYNWAACGGGMLAFTEEELEKAADHYLSIPEHWKQIVETRRKEYLAQGFKDSRHASACSIRVCTCQQHSTTDYFEFDQIQDGKLCLEMCGNLGIPKASDDYWEMPEDMSEKDLARISVRTDYFDLETGALDPTKREERRRSVQGILDTLGIVILVDFFATIHGGELLLSGAEASVQGLEFPNSVILNVPKRGKTPDHGDRTKRISSGIHDDNHPVARALDRVAEEYLPEFVVARGKDPGGVDCTERSVLNQQEIEHHKRLRDAGIPRSVHQVLHTDKEMYSSHGGSDLEHMHRGNLAEFVSGRGPVSIWVPVPTTGESISLVGYLGSHDPALKLWVHMARHYAPMKEAYLHNRTDPKGKDDDFERVWIGAARLFLKREYPGREQIRALRIPAKRFDAVLMHGLFSHGGTDELGLRFFACYSSAVSVTSFSMVRFSEG